MSGDTTGPELDCAAAVRQLWDYLDGELTPERVALVQDHLDHCGNCFRAFEIQQELLRRIRDTGATAGDPSLAELEQTVRALIRRCGP